MQTVPLHADFAAFIGPLVEDNQIPRESHQELNKPFPQSSVYQVHSPLLRYLLFCLLSLMKHLLNLWVKRHQIEMLKKNGNKYVYTLKGTTSVIGLNYLSWGALDQKVLGVEVRREHRYFCFQIHS